MATKNYTPINYLLKPPKPLSLPKEAEGVIESGESQRLQEVVEHEVTNQPKSVQIRPETIKLPPGLKKIGLQPISSGSFSGLKNITIPIRDDRVVVGLRAPITSSFRWLATLAVYVLSQAHISLKSVGGKTIRMIKR